MNPDWTHIVWTEDNLPEIRNHKQFTAMQELPGKADILRYELLFNQGGVFVDADSECVHPMDDFFLDNDSFCCWENEYVRSGLMSNGYLGACSKNKLMANIIDAISQMDYEKMFTLPPLSAWKTTGPVLLTEMVRQHKYNQMRIYPSHYFIPRHYSGLEYNGNETVYAKQYWGSTETSQGKMGMSYGT
jgi:mannosyltransferase OCH1-like enzyme